MTPRKNGIKPRKERTKWCKDRHFPNLSETLQKKPQARAVVFGNALDEAIRWNA